ncbi:hypothetical protein [Mycobacterium sp.]|uniref:hypothetical protein n=1 Tax=Mycobacterium sp. TaxID=1785 RepID=UPI003BAB6F92
MSKIFIRAISGTSRRLFAGSESRIRLRKTQTVPTALSGDGPAGDLEKSAIDPPTLEKQMKGKSDDAHDWCDHNRGAWRAECKKHLGEYSTSTTISAAGEANVEAPWWSGKKISE